jgi:hypothetical protein
LTNMDDPVFPTAIVVGGKGSTYRFDGFPKTMHSNQSFILEATFTASTGGPFDISSSVATLRVSTFNNSDPNGSFVLGGGVISDSGSGTIDRVTFTIVKDLIPPSLGNFPLRNGGNSVFYFILEDSDSVLEFSEGVNVIDPNFDGTGTIDPGAGSIVVSKNDLGSVVDTTVTTPPTADLGLAYLVPNAGATGDWVGHDNELAIGNGIDWLFTIPVDGNFVFDLAADLQTRFDGSVWAVDGDLVTSVFTRIGAVVAEDGDYTGSQVTNVPAGNIIAVEVQAAINELDGNDDTQQTAIDLNTSHRSNTSDPHNVTASQVGNTVAQWNANKLDDIDIVDLSGISNGEVLAFNGSSGDFEPVANGGAGTSGRPAFECNFDTDVTASEPASGAVKFDNAVPGSATTIRSSTTDINNINITTQLSRIGSGDTFIVYQVDTPTKFLYFSVTSSALVTTSYNIVGTSISGGVAIDNGAACGIASYVNTVGGAAGVASFNGRTGGVVPAAGDYDNSQNTNTSGVSGATTADALNTLNNTLSPEAVASGTDIIVAGVAYTLILTNKDNNNIIMESALSNAVTIPLNATVALPIRTKIPVMSDGVGVTTIDGATGVTINGVLNGSVVVNTQYQGALLQKRGTDTWVISGDVT